MMKKVILLFSSAVFLLNACSSGDDAQSMDSLIGTWTFYKSFDNDVEDLYDFCDLKETLIVNPDGTSSFTIYTSNSDDTCEISDSGFGTWENNGNNSYLFVFDEVRSTLEITFEDDTFYISEAYGSHNYREVYLKN